MQFSAPPVVGTWVVGATRVQVSGMPAINQSRPAPARRAVPPPTGPMTVTQGDARVRRCEGSMMARSTTRSRHPFAIDAGGGASRRGGRLRRLCPPTDPPGAADRARASGSTARISAPACGAWCSRRLSAAIATMAQTFVYQALTRWLATVIKVEDVEGRGGRVHAADRRPLSRHPARRDAASSREEVTSDGRPDRPPRCATRPR